MDKVGRPSKYDPKKHPEQAYRLALLGATMSEMANFFEINEDSLHEWKKNYTEFSEAIKEGKINADSVVSKSLYKRAVGFEYVETSVEVNGDKVIEKTTTKYMPPDVAAANIWLKNRRGKNKVTDPEGQAWADKQEIEQQVTGSIEQIVIFKLPEKGKTDE